MSLFARVWPIVRRARIELPHQHFARSREELNVHSGVPSEPASGYFKAFFLKHLEGRLSVERADRRPARAFSNREHIAAAEELDLGFGPRRTQRIQLPCHVANRKIDIAAASRNA